MENLEDILNQVTAVEETRKKQELEQKWVADTRILTFKKGATYTGRLLPNNADIPHTFTRYKDVGFESRVSNQYIYCGRSPKDAGVKDDIINALQWEEYKKAKAQGDEAWMKQTYKLIPRNQALVNFYLTSVEGDDAQKDKEGTVVVLKYPAQETKEGVPTSDIHRIIYNAVFGDKKAKIGKKAFDLTANGKSLCIKVTVKKDYNNYSETEFDDAEDLGLSAKQIKEIHESTHNLQEFIPQVKPKEELQKIIDEHWFGTSASSEDEVDEDELDNAFDTSVSEEDDEIPGLSSKAANKKPAKDDLDDLLEDFDD